MINSVMGLLFPLITFPYASRILLPAGIGKVNFANSIISYFAMLAGLGINIYAVREAAKKRDNRDLLSQFSQEIFTLNMISTIFSYILFFIALFTITKLHDYKTLLILSSTTIIFKTIGVNWLYTAEEEYEYITVRSLVFQIISLFFLFIFVKTKDDYLQYTAMGILSTVGSNICNLFHSRKYIDWWKHYKLNIKQHLKPVFVFFGMALVTSIYMILDTSMLGFLSTDEQVGYYEAAIKLNRMALTLITASAAVLLPRLSYYKEIGRENEFISLFNKALRYVIFISVPAAVGLFMLSYPLTMLLSGNNYVPSVLPMKIITPIMIMISISGTIGIQLFASIGKEKLTLLSAVAGAVMNFTLNSILIPRYGAAGAAIGTVMAETTVTTVQLIMARKYIKREEHLISLVQIIIASFIMGCVIFFVQKLSQNNVIQVISSIITGAAVYAVITLLIKNPTALEIGQFAIKKIKKETRIGE